MGELTHRITATDGLPLVAREWADGNQEMPLLCLPGLVRTAGDFAAFAARHGKGRRVISLDYAGRGESGRARRVARYGPEACLRDVLDVCAALHVPHAIAIGTSFGGLLSMGLAAARPGLIRRVVLNDIGPEIPTGGVADIKAIVGTDPALPDIASCVVWLRTHLPPLSLETDSDWAEMAALTFRCGEDGHFHPNWDLRIAQLLDEPRRDLWPLFGALAAMPLMLVHGAVSTVLLTDTVARMQAQRPDMVLVSLPGIGHAPSLAEAPVAAALDRFLA